MKKLILPLILAATQLHAFAQSRPASRPHITGIDHVTFYTTAPDGVRKLYAEILGLAPADPVEAGGTIRYVVGQQWVGYSAAVDPHPTDRMDHVAFATDNIVGLNLTTANLGSGSITFQTYIPEPTTLLLLGTGVLGLAKTLRRK